MVLYSSLFYADSLLSKALKEGIRVNQVGLQYALFIMEGNHLIAHNQPLYTDDFMVSKVGFYYKESKYKYRKYNNGYLPYVPNNPTLNEEGKLNYENAVVNEDLPMLIEGIDALLNIQHLKGFEVASEIMRLPIVTENLNIEKAIVVSREKIKRYLLNYID